MMNVSVREGQRGVPEVFVEEPIAGPPVPLMPGADPDPANDPLRRRLGKRVRVGMAIAVLTIVGGAALLAPVVISLAGAPGPNMIDPGALTATFGLPTGPSAEHLFGVDQLGRDVFSRTVYGARSSLAVALPATVLALVFGVAVGMVAGFRGGRLDALLSRSIEMFLVIPYLLLAIGIAAGCSGPEGCVAGTLRPGVPLLIMVIAVASWPGIARLTRNQTIAIATSDYIAQARLAGLSTRRILTVEILPNLSGSILAFVAILLPQAILAEAALSFLGVGLPSPTASWGRQIASAVSSFPEAWWMMLFPGLVLLATVMAVVVAGDYVRDRLDLAEGTSR